MRGKVKRQHNDRNNLGCDPTNKSVDYTVDSDSITIGTNKPLNQIMI